MLRILKRASQCWLQSNGFEIVESAPSYDRRDLCRVPTLSGDRIAVDPLVDVGAAPSVQDEHYRRFEKSRHKDSQRRWNTHAPISALMAYSKTTPTP